LQVRNELQQTIATANKLGFAALTAIDIRDQTVASHTRKINMTQKMVDYYFAYLSPYAFLANTRIEQALKSTGATLRYHPLAHGASSARPAMNPAKLAYIIGQDIPRFAEQYGLRFTSKPILTESYTASMGFLYAQEEGAGEKYNDLVFRARWSNGKDISRPDVLTAIAKQAGLDADAFRKSIGEPSYRDKLAQIKQQATAAGVFGVPFFIYETKKFWGNDRIDWLARELEKSAA
jgi:2-hydroxychromene-2-carboxylate isomerase